MPASPRAGDRHVGDVDSGVAEERADLADHARHVVVAEEDEQRRELHLQLEAERADQPHSVVAADRRAGDTELLSIRPHGNADKVREVATGAPALLDHLDSALVREQRRVHVVDGLLEAALEGAVQPGGGQEPGVVVGQVAEVGQLDPLRATAGQLHGEPAELGCQRHERAEHLEVVPADRRDVHRVRDEAAREGRRDLLGDDHAGPVLRLLRGGGEMRRDDHAVDLQQGA